MCILNYSYQNLADKYIRIRRKRPSLRIIVSSATIDAAHFLDFFQQGNDADDAIVVSLEGRQHPVEVAYLKEPVADYMQAAVEVAWKINLQVCYSLLKCLVSRQGVLSNGRPDSNPLETFSFS